MTQPRQCTWVCREIDCEGRPHGEPFLLKMARDIFADQAAEEAAGTLDDREHDEDWGAIDGTRRTVEVLSGTRWRRFRVTARVRVEYQTVEEEVKP